MAGTSGVAGYTGDTAAATSATLNSPSSVVLDASGNLFIADTNNHVIRKITASTGIITTVAGNGVKGYSGDGGQANQASLNGPMAVTLDAAGNLYIADSDNWRIRKVDAATGNISTVAGNGVKANAGDNQLATSASFKYPQGVAVDGAGNIYVADFSSNTIRKVTAATGIITTVAGGGATTGNGGLATLARLNYPTGVAVDAAGNLYISESFGNTVRKVSASTGYINAFAGTGTSGATGDTGLATAATLNIPNGVSLDSAGNVYIADSGNSRIRKVDTAGIITTAAGNEATLSNPSSATLDAYGNLLIADKGHHCIKKLFESIKPTVTVSVQGGDIYAQDVTLTASEPATIYYTLDGSMPAIGVSPSLNTTGKIAITTSLRLIYYAKDLAGNISDVVTQDYNVLPPIEPNPPTGVSAVAGDGQATVSFTPPVFNGGATITSYAVTANPALAVPTTGTGTSIVVTGLTNGVAYTFTVTATNSAGTSVASAASNSVTPIHPTYALQLNFAGAPGGGAVNGGLACVSGGSCPAVYLDLNTQVSLTATPDSNSLFSGWSGCTSVSGNTCNVTMTGAKTVTATFSAVSKARIQGGAPYATLLSAYANAGNNAVIQAREVTFADGDWILNRTASPLNVFFIGGYDTSYSTVPPGDTVQHGKLLIRTGTFRPRYLKVW